MSDCKPSLTNLSPEIICCIADHLPEQDLYEFRRTCKALAARTWVCLKKIFGTRRIRSCVAKQQKLISILSSELNPLVRDLIVEIDASEPTEDDQTTGNRWDILVSHVRQVRELCQKCNTISFGYEGDTESTHHTQNMVAMRDLIEVALVSHPRMAEASEKEMSKVGAPDSTKNTEELRNYFSISFLITTKALKLSKSFKSTEFMENVTMLTLNVVLAEGEYSWQPLHKFLKLFPKLKDLSLGTRDLGDQIITLDSPEDINYSIVLNDLPKMEHLSTLTLEDWTFTENDLSSFLSYYRDLLDEVTLSRIDIKDSDNPNAWISIHDICNAHIEDCLVGCVEVIESNGSFEFVPAEETTNVLE